MKTMTCNQLAGACDKKFQAKTFDEMAKMSKDHAMEMLNQGDQAHMDAMEEMKGLMNDPEAMKQKMDKMQSDFNAQPEDN